MTEKDWRKDELDNILFDEEPLDKIKLDELVDKKEITEEKLQDNSIEEKISEYSDNQSYDQENVLNKLESIIHLLTLKENEEKKINQKDDLQNILQDLVKSQNRNNDLLVQYLKQNAEFYQQVRVNMNNENELLKKELLGERLDPLLKSIATIYGEYFYLLNVSDINEKYQKQVSYLFESIEDILYEYGCDIQRSEPGTERVVKTTKIKQPMVLTGDKSLHRKVISSFNPSVSKGKKVLYPEYISIYKYDESLEKDNQENKEMNQDENDKK